ncbi:hypothetical protein LOAG_00395 [Loa loa]|uniref:Uncharacterized protein n=1 Tax=Loa loa TaxID=7209 RepID=A0A1S0UBC8_LOALO|nr:hypothetical protein LOAG_00395 [Loa loa]EFO28083.1 hypothetical protein LOAG_00395 [Loa loa]
MDERRRNVSTSLKMLRILKHSINGATTGSSSSVSWQLLSVTLHRICQKDLRVQVRDSFMSVVTRIVRMKEEDINRYTLKSSHSNATMSNDSRMDDSSSSIIVFHFETNFGY